MNPHFIELESYSKSRPLYPKEIYQCLPWAPDQPLRVLELGSGTGLSILSLLQAFQSLDVVAIEPEAELLEYSRQQLATQANLNLVGMINTVTDSIFESHSVAGMDLIQIASAWHWFYRDVSVATLTACLKPRGRVFIHEYQFPKTIVPHPVNDWIRKQFNTVWKPAEQKPRGSLKELTNPFRQCADLRECAVLPVEMRATFESGDLSDFLFSQSRYLAYERKLAPAAIDLYRETIREELKRMMPEAREFSFHWAGFLFLKLG